MAENQDIKFNRKAFLTDLSKSISLIEQVEEMGAGLADEGVEQLLLVGCGAPHYMFRAINMWVAGMISEKFIAHLYPAELTQAGYALNERTAVIFGSHSGKTAETVAGADSLRKTEARSVAITQHADSPLAKKVHRAISYGATKQGYFSSVILTLALVNGFLHRLSPRWNGHSRLRSSLHNLPRALADAKQTSLTQGIQHAKSLRKAESMFVIGGGPMYTTAYVFAGCFLMEMQRINAHPIHALDFFHGPFELLDATTPTLLLLGEGVYRPYAERVGDFCMRYMGGCICYDASTFEMSGIDALIRPIAAPFIVDAALTNVVEQLAILRDHPLDTRRYMGKVEY